MPTLEWLGKDKVITHHETVPYRLLERQYSFDELGQHSEDNGSLNKIIHGDNLESLKALLPQYAGKIGCIYIDPPYNTGNEKWKYNDNVNDPRIRKWLHKVVGREDEDLSRHDKWLCMMYPRTRLLRELLSETGVIFISLNYADESAFMRLLCDEIFGKSNYVGELTWESTTQPSNAGSAKFGLQQKVEPILCYARNIKKVKRFQLTPVTRCKKYPHTGKFGSCRFEIIEKSDKGGDRRDTMKFRILGKLPREGKRWQIGEETAREWEQQGRLEIVDGIVKRAVYPEDEQDKVSYDPFWSHFEAERYGTAQSGKALFNTIMGEPQGFDTVKPVELLEAIFSHFPSDTIFLDSFAGTGTTAHAVLNLNARDGGTRQVILVELEDYADSITAERVKRVIQGYSGSPEREEIVYHHTITLKDIQRDTLSLRLEEATKCAEEYDNNELETAKVLIENGSLVVKVRTKQDDTVVTGVGGSFSYYELGHPLFNDDGTFHEEVDEQDIRAYIWFTETRQDRLPEGNGNPYYLGTLHRTAYYLYHIPGRGTVLDDDFLADIPKREETTVIYANRCCISEQRLAAYGIVFKKIPRDIIKL